VLTDALNTMDDAKRNAMIAQAAEIAFDETAMIPIHYEVSTWGTAAGYRYTPRADQYTLAMDLKPTR
jgi:peptide/nickel transport system substrate-binding protein